MADVLILALAEDEPGCGTPQARVPVLACADLLRKRGETVELVTAYSDAEIDAALKSDARLVVAAATDAEVRAVVRRLVRMHAPAPSKRPDDLPPNRTIPDLPALAILPLLPSVPELVTALELPTDAAEVAGAVHAGLVRRLDLLRNDAGSVTLRGSLLGGVDENGVVAAWRGRVEVDDAVLADGEELLLACAISNAGPTLLDGLPLVVNATPDDGVVEVAVAVPFRHKRQLQFEVRRARGRAVSVTPRDGEVHLVDDGVAAILTRKRSWWIEPGAFATYMS